MGGKKRRNTPRRDAMPENKVITQGNLKIELPNDDNLVQYSNFAIVSHSPEEFVIDLARIMPGKEEAKIVSRIIMTPKNAKNFANAMMNNIQGYEKQFGEIVLPQTPGAGGPAAPKPEDLH
jgi:hypothetical protein